MRNARDRQPPHVSVLQNPVFATSAHSFLLGFASRDLDRRGAELEKAHLYPRFALSTRLEGSGRNGARGVKTAGQLARVARGARPPIMSIMSAQVVIDFIEIGAQNAPIMGVFYTKMKLSTWAIRHGMARNG